ncbi:LOW QUALITY PROTEIN: FK506-binding protein 15-like [Salarias fasciatus]|uniref:LOW QUALITY PROTEIN: FK506-binding protein 15-like n=1 Tax=Salarias fasciatus TaxID=181472 RepID=UPI00117688D2|nr:LOW QUALITY PROTEIN: FK506-binding protein 15-like [Salarias fasciatus]
MFGGDDEDGDFLSPTGGAKLASLFGLDQEASGGNESFQYTAPKQPRKTSNPAPANQKAAPPPGAPAVLLATAVQAFRYINGQYVKQGKLGAAVLGSHAAREYKLLLYMSQQKQVTAAKIHTGFVFTVQLNNYCTFYDDQRQNWSLMFESDKSAYEFCKEVCLAKANSAPCLDAVVVQDLSLGEGPAVEHGDSLEVVYTGWLLQNQAFGQMFDTNQNKDKLLRLKIGAGKVIKGWEEGMLGMKKAGRRLLVIPPGLAYGAKGVPSRVPSNSTLIFEAEIRRVKFSRDSGSDRASASSRDSAAPSPAPSPAPSVESLTPEAPAPAAAAAAATTATAAATGPGRPGDPPLRSKSNSLNEQLSNPDTTKAKLISRMAKMGQPMLPFLTGVSGQPESSDSELEDSSSRRVKDRPAASSPVQIAAAAAPAAAHAHPHPHPTPVSALMPLVSSVAPGSSHHAFQPYSYTHTQSAAPSQLQPVGQVYPSQTAPYMAAGSGEVTSFLMTEARQHNTEIRLAVGKVADKVDQLVSKVDDLQRQGSLSMGVSNMSMETSMIMHNIQRIIQENECLKKEVFEKSSRIEEQNRKIGDLINENQRYMEQSHQLLEQRTDSLKSSSEHSQARLLQAEQDKVRLSEDLASAAARLSQVQLEASAHQQKAAELQSKLSSALQDGESHGRHVAALEAQLEELKEATERTQTQHRSERQKRKELELRASGLEEELQDLRADKESLERTLSERKSKWQAERRRRDEEVEELRRSSQQELDAVRAQLRRARTSSDQAASEQLGQLQAELEEEWRARSQQAAAAAEQRHRRETAELSEQRDALQEQLRQLQEKFTALKQSRDSDELRGNQSEELRVLQEKYSTLEQQAAAEREELERRVSELQRRGEDTGTSSGDTAAEVKRVMNGVFHSLRGEFELGETYSGQAVLAVIVGTIKNVTLQLLSGADRPAVPPREEEEEEEEESSEQVKEKEEKPHLNGERETEAEEDVRRNESQQVREDQEGEEEEAPQRKKEEEEEAPPRKKEEDQEEEEQTEAELKTPHLTEAPQPVGPGPDPDPDPAAELQPPETEAEPAEIQQEVQHSAPAQEGDASKSAQDAHEGYRPEDGRETESERREERREERRGGACRRNS